MARLLLILNIILVISSFSFAGYVCIETEEGAKSCYTVREYKPENEKKVKKINYSTKNNSNTTNITNINSMQLNECFLSAANRYNIPVALLYAIAKVESGFRPYIININSNGKSIRVINPSNYEEAVKTLEYLYNSGYNFDVGIGQINVWNIKRLRLNYADLLDPCKNIHVSAYILKENVDRYGLTWDAIWRYNGRKDYAFKVYKALLQMGAFAKR